MVSLVGSILFSLTVCQAVHHASHQNSMAKASHVKTPSDPAIREAPPKLPFSLVTEVAIWRLGQFLATSECLNASIDLADKHFNDTGLSRFTSKYTYWVERNATGQPVFRVEKQVLPRDLTRKRGLHPRIDDFIHIVESLPADKLDASSPLLQGERFSILADWQDARGDAVDTKIPVWSYNRMSAKHVVAMRKPQILFPLLHLEDPSHFWALGIKKEDMTAWETKKDALFWGGGPSGSLVGTDGHTHLGVWLDATMKSLSRKKKNISQEISILDQFDRAWAVKRLGSIENQKLCDTEIHVWFTKNKVKKLASFLGMYGYNVQPPITKDELDAFKFLLVLEGNDVATALPTALLSSSVPLMFEPPIWESVLHFHLTPWHHYIPVKRKNIADLTQKISWCKENEEKCHQIAQNGRNLMEKYWGSDADETLIRVKTLDLAAAHILKTCKPQI
uniref:Glycosyl transferase CAP10 domain-containing protein n=1 Tax=Amorphochlora amoebiformis TaxID=1561963 RepID=A0A7S0GWU2_9EUKA|mmetsp:Transcript_20350/g.32234  ORF Transcript_20350/g.32234 Transcript_20350/m.32234 type:complete len:449 (+) Transcript_20350:483-1829(+)